jgi:hypothetical protein
VILFEKNPPEGLTEPFRRLVDWLDREGDGIEESRTLATQEKTERADDSNAFASGDPSGLEVVTEQEVGAKLTV